MMDKWYIGRFLCFASQELMGKYPKKHLIAYVEGGQ